jgi:ABC-type lipoprotein release transport system permease subunit
MVPADLRDNEIIINQWLADDLRIGPGAELAISYFLMDSGTRLTERTNTFQVRAVIPMDSPLCDRTLMPEFPGIAKAESTSDWDAGFPLVHKIRPKDDQYWKQYRGTPKGFITLAAGQKLWGNRFGDLTAVRFLIQEENLVYGRDNIHERPNPLEQVVREAPAKFAKDILARFLPYHIGLRFEPVREQALAAANQAQDFAELFISFSFFLIVAALILTALMFRFGLEQRLPEAGLLLAVGYTPRMVRRVFLREGLFLSIIGSLLGVAGGIFYARAVLHGLTTIWKDATGFSSLTFHISPISLAIGIISGVAVAVFSLWLVLRKLGQQPATALLASQLGTPLKATARRPWLSVTALLVALGMAAGALATGQTANAEIFFSSGSLLLIALIGLSRWWLGRLTARPVAPGAFTLASLALQGCSRRRGRSVATISLLACGCFLISAIGVFRLDADRDATRRASGTGGFALLGEASVPVLRDLDTAEGRDFYSLPASFATNASVVSLRVRDGDEASCLNLNRAQTPRLLGVSPAALQSRQAFTFAAVLKGASHADGWKLLERDFARQKFPDLKPDEIPAIGDAAAIQWALHKSLGDTLDYTDERGQTFKLRLVGAVANSILQGNLLIDEAEFTRRFPSESGYRFFLVDVPSDNLAPEVWTKHVADISSTMGRALQNTGLELTPAARRLAQFNAVQNTYLNTFQVLGALGLLLGTAGLAAVVLRNMLERRAELALLLALGFRPAQLPRLVMREHALLLLAGLGIGVLSAAVAVAPALLVPGTQIPWRSLSLTLGLVFLSGLAWTWLAARAAVRGNLLRALRNE